MNTRPLALAGAILLAGTAAHAAPIALRVAPAILELDLQRGQTHHFAVTVANEAHHPLLVEVHAADLELTPHGLPLIAPAGSRPQSCASWLSPDQHRFTLQPDDTRDINVTIAVPPAARGGAYGILALRVTPAGPLPREPLSLSVVGNTGTILMLTIRGPTRARASIPDARATPEADAVALSALVRNDGNIHLRCAANAVIFGPDNRVHGRIPLDAGSGLVLPAGTRQLAAHWTPRSLPPGEYRAQITVTAPPAPSVRHTIAFSVPEP